MEFALDKNLIYIPMILLIVALACDIVRLLGSEHAQIMRKIAHWLIIFGAIAFIPVLAAEYMLGQMLEESHPHAHLQQYFAWGAFSIIVFNAILRIYLLNHKEGNAMRMLALVVSILAVAITIWTAEIANYIIKS